jgi:hypothetical protein
VAPLLTGAKMEYIRHRHRVTRNIRTANCLVSILYLFITGRICKIVYIAKRHHYVGVTPRGMLVHFKTTTRRDEWAPYLFSGYIETIGRYHPYKHKEFTNLKSLLLFVLSGYFPKFHRCNIIHNGGYYAKKIIFTRN